MSAAFIWNGVLEGTRSAPVEKTGPPADRFVEEMNPAQARDVAQDFARRRGIFEKKNNRASEENRTPDSSLGSWGNAILRRSLVYAQNVANVPSTCQESAVARCARAPLVERCAQAPPGRARRQAARSAHQRGPSRAQSAIRTVWVPPSPARSPGQGHTAPGRCPRVQCRGQRADRRDASSRRSPSAWNPRR